MTLPEQILTHLYNLPHGQYHNMESLPGTSYTYQHSSLYQAAIDQIAKQGYIVIKENTGGMYDKRITVGSYKKPSKTIGGVVYVPLKVQLTETGKNEVKDYLSVRRALKLSHSPRMNHPSENTAYTSNDVVKANSPSGIWNNNIVKIISLIVPIGILVFAALNYLRGCN